MGKYHFKLTFLLGDTEKNAKILNHNSRLYGRDSNRVSPMYKSEEQQLPTEFYTDIIEDK
jgi:hypothetical protein